MYEKSPKFFIYFWGKIKLVEHRGFIIFLSRALAEWPSGRQIRLSRFESHLALRFFRESIAMLLSKLT
jgi:hypothetical protein